MKYATSPREATGIGFRQIIWIISPYVIIPFGSTTSQILVPAKSTFCGMHSEKQIKCKHFK